MSCRPYPVNAGSASDGPWGATPLGEAESLSFDRLPLLQRPSAIEARPPSEASARMGSGVRTQRSNRLPQASFRYLCPRATGSRRTRVRGGEDLASRQQEPAHAATKTV